MFYLTTLNTFYLRLYGVTHMVKDNSDSKRGNLLPPHGLLFPISSYGSFIGIISQPLLHHAQKVLYLFLLLCTYLLNIMVSTTQTLAQIKPQEFIGHIKQHHMATQFLTYITNSISRLCKMLYQKLATPRPSTQQHAIWWTTTCILSV